MTRADGASTLKRFDDLDEAIAAELDTMRTAIRRWAKAAVLNRDPDLPLRHRAADNWRPLIAIADDVVATGAKRRATPLSPCLATSRRRTLPSRC